MRKFTRLNISPGFSGVDVIEIVYDMYPIADSGPPGIPRDAYIFHNSTGKVGDEVMKCCNFAGVIG